MDNILLNIITSLASTMEKEFVLCEVSTELYMCVRWMSVWKRLIV